MCEEYRECAEPGLEMGGETDRETERQSDLHCVLRDNEHLIDCPPVCRAAFGTFVNLRT